MINYAMAPNDPRSVPVPLEERAGATWGALACHARAAFAAQTIGSSTYYAFAMLSHIELA